MTKIQLRFLQALYKSSMTSIELCKKLGISPIPNDIGGYYNALNQRIDYLTSDEKSEIEDYFTITFDTHTNFGEELYQITSEGKQFLANYKKEAFNNQITIAGIIIAILTLIVAIIALF